MDTQTQGSSPRGTKRRAEASPDEFPLPRRIKPLDADVVNKIAAGEIIVAPVQALKELIENAVDAGSTSVEVLVKEGGLKLLQITDNGCGIDKDDLPRLCERFTTSKLEKFEDLSTIATYGFRGEALASISHIAHLSVTTKTRKGGPSGPAWRARYGSGKLVPWKAGESATPTPVAGRPGTQITVEDLFYNVPTRRRAFRSASDEYNKIIDMVGAYAIHRSNVAFSCKKAGESSHSIAIRADASVIDRIRQIYGSAVANELLEFSTSDARWGFQSEGWATNANYGVKKMTLLLFINHRSVDSSRIRKALEQTYASILPKGAHPFVYLSLDIDPKRVDVNVHPTKREVNFLNEDEITQAICEHIRSKLAAVDTSRNYTVQTLLPGQLPGWSTPGPQPRADTASPATILGSGPKKTPGRPYENNLVRTDANLRKITSMLQPVASSSAKPALPTALTTSDSDPQHEMIEYEMVDREATTCRLESVSQLRAVVREEEHSDLRDILANHTFVGIADDRRRLAAIQTDVKLYCVDYGYLCYEYFYQRALTDIGNIGVIRFNPPLDLRRLLTMAAELENEDPNDIEEVVGGATAKLIERREMLLEYFSLEISPVGELVSIPLLVRGYTPAVVKLPRYLLRIARGAEWEEENAFMDFFLRELAAFYVPEQLPPAPDDAPGDAEGDADADVDGDAPQPSPERKAAASLEARRAHVRRAVEYVLFPAFKQQMIATKALSENAILEVANLKYLYRVFERC